MIGFIGTIQVRQNPKNTRYHFGELSGIAGRRLRVIERNKEGDCLCLDPYGKGLVDVDARDIEPDSFQR